MSGELGKREFCLQTVFKLKAATLTPAGIFNPQASPACFRLSRPHN